MSEWRLAPILDQLVAVEQTIHPALRVYRWWQPDMLLPAVWNWLTPGATESPDQCSVRDTVRLTVSVGVDPRAHVGADMVALEELIDAARVALDAAVWGSPPVGGAQRARRTGLQTVSDRLGDAPVLAAEFPLELTLLKPINP